MHSKLNTWTLSGLIIGPILGSGIVLLPPLAYGMMGDQALIAWLIIMALGAVFAYVFTQLSIISPGNEGVSIAIGKVLGPVFQEMASNFLIAAVSFGPVAVLFVASDYVGRWFPSPLNHPAIVTWFLLLICGGGLLRGVSFIGKVTFVLSSAIGLLLLMGGISTLLTTPAVPFHLEIASIHSLGQTLLLLFWAIIGWEIVGNYVEDIENPRATLLKAMALSIGVITLIYLISAWSLQNYVLSKGSLAALDMSLILEPLFGSLGMPILALTASGLCICTYLMVVGGITRLAASKAKAGRLPKFCAPTNQAGTPVNMILIMTCLHGLIIGIVSMGWLNVERLVAMANAFFIANAIIGLIAGFKLIPQAWIKVPILLLIGAFAILFFYSKGWVLIMVFAVFLVSFMQSLPQKTLGPSLPSDSE